MSFEDDMLEDGFSDEQDYLDYLCNKADSKFFYEDEDGWKWKVDRQNKEFQFRVNNNKLLQQWKLTDEKGAKIWAFIWTINKKKAFEVNRFILTDYREEKENNLFYSDWYHDIPMEGCLWAFWSKSEEAFRNWKEANPLLWDNWKKEIDERTTKEFFFKFTNNSILLDSFNLCRDFMVNHGYPLKDAEELRKDAIVSAWRENFVHSKSKEEILFDYWRESNSKEWLYWLRINYPRIRYITINSEQTPFSTSWKFFYNSIQEYYWFFHPVGYFSEEKRDLSFIPEYIAETEATLKEIVKEQINDWWQYFVDDIITKYKKAVDNNYIDLFGDFEDNRSESSIEAYLREIRHNINTHSGVFSSEFTERTALSRIVMTHSFYLDIMPEPFQDEEEDDEEETPKPRKRKPLDDDDDFEPIELSEEDKDRFRRRDKERASLQAGFMPPYTDDFQAYCSEPFPSRDDYYKRLTANDSQIVFYFLRGHLEKEMLGALNRGSADWISFRRKDYHDSNDIIDNECSLTRFNKWCIRHRLPSLLDYVFKYWAEQEVDDYKYALYIWLKFWRGEKWIQYYFDEIDDYGLFLKWKELHQKEWDIWEKQNFAQYLDMYKYVDAFRCLIKEGNKDCISFLNQEKNPVNLKMKDALEQSYMDWLSEGYSQSEIEEKEQAFIDNNHPLFIKYKEKMYRKEWNESHPEDKHLIYGLDEPFYLLKYNYHLSDFIYYDLFDTLFPKKES